MSTNIQMGKIQIVENCYYNEEVHNAGKGHMSCENDDKIIVYLSF